ncbi:MAG: hypothetical protein EOO15_16340 [Chitinophagaceae bacterium]|nr:MAG: hypothetical protein EOO15_16340 [Chitinophagaceae bacterium]
MSQNLLSLDLTAADFNEIDAAITKIEEKFIGLIDLAIEERRSLSKMGDKSEAFCRQTLTVLLQNPQIVPPSLDLADAQRDLAHLDALRTRTARLRQLLGRADDSVMALGSDVMSAALDGYALLKVMGKGSGLDNLRQGIAARFSRGSRVPKAESQA